MYKVIEYFTDLQDNSYIYNPGDLFPREGLTVSDSRLKELAGKNNKQGKPLIEKIKVEEELPEDVKEIEEPKEAPVPKKKVKK